ncbi:MAG: T9SS type A sorting domain-containing protein [Calditrichia bacterium]
MPIQADLSTNSSDSQGNFVITWFDNRGPSLGLYAQLFSNNGERLGLNFKINDDSAVPTWTEKDISFDRSDNFIVVWTGADYHVYGQRFDKYGQRTTAQNFEVASEDMSSQKNMTQLGVAASDSGNFMVTWPWDPTDLSDRTICARLFNDDSSPAGDPFIIPSWNDSNSQKYPGVASAGNGDFIFTWSEGDSFLHDIYYDNIYAQKFSKTGEPLDTPVKINDDSLSCADQTHPSLILNQNGEFTVTWQDYRNGNPDIYVQKFSADGTPLDSPYTVGSDIPDENYAPVGVKSESGNFLIAWLGRGPSNYDWNVYAQLFTDDASPQGEIFKVNENSNRIRLIESSLSTATDSLGNIIIGWSQSVNTIYGKIFGQRFTNMGKPVGPNFIVNADSAEVDHFSPSVAMWPDGQTVFAWSDNRNGIGAIYAQLYASDGQKMGGNFLVSPDNECHCFFPGLAIAPSGDFLMCWYEYNQVDSTKNLVMQRFSRSGARVDSVIRISDRPAFVNAELRNPVIAFNETGDFVIVWESGNTGADLWEMFGQRFSAQGTPIGKNFQITTGKSRTQHSPDVKLQGKNIYCVWQDNQGTPSDFNTGYDIMANVLDFDTPVGIDGKEPISLSGSFALDQNFPNPFNPSTTLTYRLARSVKVQLTIFDLLGRKIRLLLDDRQAAGFYEVLWDGNDDRGVPVASGVYIYRLKAGNYSKSHKMILIR